MNEKFKLLILLPCILIISVCTARTLEWDNSAGDQDFTNPANWYDSSTETPVTNLLTDDICQIKMDDESEYPIIGSDINVGKIQCGINGAGGRLDIVSYNATANALSYVGHGNGSIGVLNVSGGSLFVDERLMVGNLNGTGTLNLSGGSITTASGRHIYFPFNTGTGNLNMTGGIMTAGGNLCTGGSNGAGIANVSITGGNLNAVAVRTGEKDGDITNMVVEGSSEISIDEYFGVGIAAGSTNNVTFGGNAIVNANRINIGFNGSSGTIDIKENAVVTTEANLTVQPEGVFKLHGSSAQVDIGGDAFFHSGSQLTFILDSSSLVPGMNIGNTATIDGSLDIEIVNADQLTVGDSYSVTLAAGDFDGTILTDPNAVTITGDQLRGYASIIKDSVVVVDNQDSTKTLQISFYLEDGPSCEDIIAMGEVLPGDLNHDCYVDIHDIAIIASSWLLCNDPFTDRCN